MFGFYRLAAAVPPVQVADVGANVAEIQKLWRQANSKKVALVAFPELSVSAYTCADLFGQKVLLEKVEAALVTLCKASRSLTTAAVVGAPLIYADRLYNCAVVIHQGKIHGVVPKSFLANRREFYEKRWFSSGEKIHQVQITVGGEDVPFGPDLIFAFADGFTFGIEICEDLWHVVPPSSWQALSGATVLVNLSASNELIGKADYRRHLVRSQSARCYAAYVYSSAGIGESTTDLVFGGHCLIAENGSMVAESTRFAATPQLAVADVDCERLVGLRLMEAGFGDRPPRNHRLIKIGKAAQPGEINVTVNPRPFVPDDASVRTERCQEIFQIQTTALKKRLLHAKAKAAVIGVSGGLDSTLALLATCRAFDEMKKPRKGVIGLTMPGFGTSDRTFKNARALAGVLGITLKEIDIREACSQHFKEIGFDPKERGTTYENIQARERTLYLMSVANQNGGLVIGTGDLSEAALGWSTYNGDHMSMYNVNCSIPKTLIKYLVEWYAEQGDTKVKSILADILATPISPELLPGKGRGIHQKTEEIVGPFELHDFFLYHLVRYGASPEKIKFLAAKAFAGKYSPTEIKKWLRIFIERFFANQFKRSCTPDGPKVGTIGLSPRGDWRMPSDAVVQEWLMT